MKFHPEINGVHLGVLGPFGPRGKISKPGFETFDFHVGCNISDAWVGVDLGADKVVEQVRCVRIFQAGVSWGGYLEDGEPPRTWMARGDRIRPHFF